MENITHTLIDCYTLQWRRRKDITDPSKLLHITLMTFLKLILLSHRPPQILIHITATKTIWHTHRSLYITVNKPVIHYSEKPPPPQQQQITRNEMFYKSERQSLSEADGDQFQVYIKLGCIHSISKCFIRLLLTLNVSLAFFIHWMFH